MACSSSSLSAPFSMQRGDAVVVLGGEHAALREGELEDGVAGDVGPVDELVDDVLIDAEGQHRGDDLHLEALPGGEAGELRDAVEVAGGEDLEGRGGEVLRDRRHELGGAGGRVGLHLVGGGARGVGGLAVDGDGGPRGVGLAGCARGRGLESMHLCAHVRLLGLVVLWICDCRRLRLHGDCGSAARAVFGRRGAGRGVGEQGPRTRNPPGSPDWGAAWRRNTRAQSCFVQIRQTELYDGSVGAPQGANAAVPGAIDVGAGPGAVFAACAAPT
jgi:hypothetical protein